ncbi:MAG TPA: hypothetical protein VK672_03160 [Solirubrobacteraceae bacterium]|jgi:hypothetical protein|nr:hypothetical protein [Solirubrobacteraceae bacterium]
MHRPEETGNRSWASSNDPSSTPVDGGYLTDGETLFRIERTLVEDARGDLLVELEDCGTLELIVCSSRAVNELGLRPVRPLASIAS